MSNVSKESVRKCVAERRALARERGLCPACCKESSPAGCVTCVRCNASAKQRVRRLREKKRQVADLSQIMQAYERDGDVFRTHHLYMDAAQRYQDALSVEGIQETDQLRIVEKLGDALGLGVTPDVAKSWYERLLVSYLQQPEQGIGAFNALSKMRGFLSTSSWTASTLPLLEQMMRIAKLCDVPELIRKTHVATADVLLLLGRYADAKASLDALGGISDTDSPELRAGYCGKLGYYLAMQGQKEESFENFERALETLVPSSSNDFRTTVAWSNYGLAALSLGQTNIAKKCYDNALTVAREKNVAWRIPILLLDNARTLGYMGDYELAHDYLRDALSYDARSSILDQEFAYAGIPLALHMQNDELLEKCTRFRAIEDAFCSGEPSRIRVVAAAFAQLYAERGKRGKARALLRRALNDTSAIDDAWDFPVEVARFGAAKDIPAARRLLEARLQYPYADVYKAYLELFDAYAAQRRGQTTEAHRYAQAAITRFNALQWYGCAERARAILPVEQREAGNLNLPARKAFAELQTQLTKREREVADFILQGLTSRAIAEKLEISPHTVDSHVNSLMNRLGIRSRYELTYILSHS